MPTPPIFSGRMSLAGLRSQTFESEFFSLLLLHSPTISIIKPNESRKWNIHTVRHDKYAFADGWRVMTVHTSCHSTQFILIHPYWLHLMCVKMLRKYASAMAVRTKINGVFLCSLAASYGIPNEFPVAQNSPKLKGLIQSVCLLFGFGGSCAGHKSVNKFNKL